MGVAGTHYDHKGPECFHHAGYGQSADVVLLRLGRQYLLFMVSEGVLDVDPHDQGQHLDEEPRTGTVRVTGPRPGPVHISLVDIERLLDPALVSYDDIISSQSVPSEANITNIPALLESNENEFCNLETCTIPSSSTLHSRCEHTSEGRDRLINIADRPVIGKNNVINAIKGSSPRDPSFLFPEGPMGKGLRVFPRHRKRG